MNHLKLLTAAGIVSLTMSAALPVGAVGIEADGQNTAAAAAEERSVRTESDEIRAEMKALRVMAAEEKQAKQEEATPGEIVWTMLMPVAVEPVYYEEAISDDAYDADSEYSEEAGYDEDYDEDYDYEDESESYGNYDEDYDEDYDYEDESESYGNYDEDFDEDYDYEDESESYGNYDEDYDEDYDYEDESSSSRMTASQSDLDLLASIIYCEAGGESYEGQVAVGAVVLNRMESDLYPSDMTEVIYQSGQFEPVWTGWLEQVRANGAPDYCYEAAQAALDGENPVGDRLFFHAGTGGTLTIGNQTFY